VRAGFLGAGKTVLLNRILSNPGGRRICVIENEAGAVSIDHALLAGR
jgi:G3E family GTPase